MGNESILNRIIDSHQSQESKLQELLTEFAAVMKDMVKDEVARQLPMAVARALEIGVNPQLYK
jgi:hypothetical protein